MGQRPMLVHADSPEYQLQRGGPEVMFTGGHPTLQNSNDRLQAANDSAWSRVDSCASSVDLGVKRPFEWVVSRNHRRSASRDLRE
jgi:hypothetical protein